MKQFNVLVADPISKDGIKALLDHEQFNVDIQTGLSEEALIKIIPSYHALIVRSQTTVTENIINAADSLKVNQSMYYNPNSPHKAGLQANQLLQ